MARLVVIGAAQKHDRRSTAVVFVAEVDAAVFSSPTVAYGITVPSIV